MYKLTSKKEKNRNIFIRKKLKSVLQFLEDITNYTVKP